MTFEVGDKVIYPNHGLGIVERIEEKTILGTTCGFYHLRIVANDTTVLVPVSNVDGVGLRRAISDEEVERLFGLLGDGKIDNHQNWKGRFKDNSDKMRSGSIYEVADVLKSLTFLAKSKSLSFREKRMLDRAKFLIISEVSEVMRETAAAIEGRVDRALERCFTTKARTATRRAAREGREGGAARGRQRGAGTPHRTAHRSRSPQLDRLRRCQPGGPHGSPGVFVYDAARVLLIAAIRSLLTYVAVSLYVLIVAPPGMLLGDLFGAKQHLYVLGHIGVRLGLALSRHPLRSGRPRARAARRAAVYCSNHQSNVDPPIIFDALHPRMHILYKSEIAALPILDARVPLRRLHSDRSPQQGGGDAVDRSGRRVHSQRQLVSDLSRGDAQPHRRTPAVQERRLHHGDQGTGADGAGGGAGRARLDAEGQLDHPAGDGQRAHRRGDRIERLSARSAQRADRGHASAN